MEKQRLSRIATRLAARRLPTDEQRKIHSLAFQRGLDPCIVIAIALIEDAYRPRGVRIVEKVVFALAWWTGVKRRMTLGLFQYSYSTEQVERCWVPEERIWHDAMELVVELVKSSSGLEEVGERYNGSAAYGAVFCQVCECLRTRRQQSIAPPSLRSLAGEPVEYSDLRLAVQEAGRLQAKLSG